MAYRYVFGPVSSLRLGLSLGLDLLGDAVCTFDCLYCEVGPTRRLTLRRAPYVSARTILDELESWARQAKDRPDHVTLGGMGEPCLNLEFGAVIDGARAILPGVPVAVLTNSSLLDNAQVRRDLARADVVLPSMDTLAPEEFARLNRPHPGLDAASVAQGLLEFRRGFKGRLLLEILLVRGMNDSEANLALLEQYCRELGPDRVDVVTMTRPGAWREAAPVDQAVLDRWRRALTQENAAQAPPKRAACAGATHFTADAAALEALREAIIASVSRRPQTPAQLACALGAPETLVRAVLGALADKGLVRPEQAGDETFFVPARPGRP